MSLLDTYRRNAQRKREDIAKLQRDKANVSGRVANLSQKINSASSAAARSKSPSIISCKIREIERLQNDVVREERKIADIEKRIGTKQKELSSEESKISREDQTEATKRVRESKKQEQQRKKEFSEITQNLRRHETLHRSTQNALEELQRLPEKITVLFLAANPVDQNPLRLDEEVRSITEKIRLSKHRDSVELKSAWAIRPLDLLQALNEHSPTIVHFSGHGSETGDLVFQNDSGGTKLVSKKAMAQSIAACAEGIRLIFFNSCYSNLQAQVVVESIEAAIGMKSSIGDDAARVFAASFYSAIGFGKSLETAFNQAKAALLLENIPEDETPELFARTGVDPSESILVRPFAQNPKNSNLNPPSPLRTL